MKPLGFVLRQLFLHDGRRVVPCASFGRHGGRRFQNKSDISFAVRDLCRTRQKRGIAAPDLKFGACWFAYARGMEEKC